MGLFGIGTHNNARIAQGLDYENFRSLAFDATDNVLIDNYIDESVLTMLSARSPGVSATIYTKHFSRKLRLDLQRYNAQYPPVVIKAYQGAHDRFLILDDTTVYHIGASLKDLGKSLFAFSRMEFPAKELLDRLP